MFWRRGQLQPHRLLLHQVPIPASPAFSAPIESTATNSNIDESELDTAEEASLAPALGKQTGDSLKKKRAKYDRNYADDADHALTDEDEGLVQAKRLFFKNKNSKKKKSIATKRRK